METNISTSPSDQDIQLAQLMILLALRVQLFRVWNDGAVTHDRRREFTHHLFSRLRKHLLLLSPNRGEEEKIISTMGTTVKNMTFHVLLVSGICLMLAQISLPN